MDARAVRRWYRTRRSSYPWRTGRPDPYAVLVSEVMLQQTQAVRVVPAYRSFLRRFPTVAALAQAPRGDVLRAWAGLGYNRRARALSDAARLIVIRHGGRVPSDPDTLVSLPGVGPYTAAAVASLAYGMSVPALDTNVRRVVARAELGAEPEEVSGAELRSSAEAALDRSDPAGWNQALMDLGREVCRPMPRCPECPLAPGCRFRLAGRRPARTPRRQGRFEGSTRQARGSVVAVLRERSSATVATLARLAGRPLEDVASAVRSLADDGIVAAGPAARGGHARGRVRLLD